MLVLEVGFEFSEVYSKESKDYLSDILFRYGENGKFYFEQNGSLKSVSLENKIDNVTNNISHFMRFKNYYIVKKHKNYLLYRFANTKLLTFRLKRQDVLDNFFILKNHLYLIGNDKIFAQADLETKKLHYIKPVNFYDLYQYDTNDNFVAYATRDYHIKILDANLTLIKEYKVNPLPTVFSYAIDRKNIAYIDYEKKKVFFNGKALVNLQTTDTNLALDDNRIAIVTYDRYTKKLSIEIYNGIRHTKSYEFKIKAKFINKVLLYKDTLIISFTSKALFIKNGKIVKKILYKHQFSNRITLKKVKNIAYLSYNDVLKEISLDTLKTKYISSKGYGIQNGEDILAYVDKFMQISLIVEFGGKKIPIALVNDLDTYFVLKNYVIVEFINDKTAVYVISKNKTIKLKLTSKHNLILNLFGLDNNRFAVVDGFGLRIIDLDRLKSLRR